MNDDFIVKIWNSYVNSPAIWATLLFFVFLVLAFKFGKEIINFLRAGTNLLKTFSHLLKNIDTIKHKKGEFYLETKKPPTEKEYEQITKEYNKLLQQLESSKNEKEKLTSNTKESDYLMKLINDLIQENEDNKYALFFERLINRLQNWQYNILVLGYNSEDHKMITSQIKENLRNLHSDFDEHVSEQFFNSTLNGFITLNLIIIDEGETIRFTNLSNSFVNYISYVYGK